MKLLALITLLLVTLTHCTTPGPTGRGSRRVSLPGNLDEHERQHLRMATEVLVDFGYTPTGTQGAEYALAFSIDEGPINVDTTIILTQRGVEVARGEGRDGGPHIIFDRPGVIRASVEEATADFEDQIERITR